MLYKSRSIHGYHQSTAIVVDIHQMLHKLGPALIEVGCTASIVRG